MTTEKLFSYGTLQLENVQLENFGRKLISRPDALLGYEIRDCLINDAEVIKQSGKAVHPIACFTGCPKSAVAGTVFEITPAELQQADKYEVADYKRVKCELQSGELAWTYVQSGLNIDPKYLQNSPVRLKPFQDHHIPTLCELATDAKIWQYNNSSYQHPAAFREIYIEKALSAIKNKKRYMFVIYHDNKAVGSTSYYDINLEHRKLTIGYTWLIPEYWGSGINQTIKKLMLDYAFQHLKFKRVAFCIDSENIRSRKAIERLGVPLEGVLMNHQIRPDGSNRHSAIYAITDFKCRQ